MYSFIFNDEMDWEDDEFLMFPSHIANKTGNLLPVFCGKTMNAESMLVTPEDYKNSQYGIYVLTRDYDSIDFNKPLILVHDYYAGHYNQEQWRELVLDMWNTYSADSGDHIHISAFKVGELQYVKAKQP